MADARPVARYPQVGPAGGAFAVGAPRSVIHREDTHSPTDVHRKELNREGAKTRRDSCADYADSTDRGIQSAKICAICGSIPFPRSFFASSRLRGKKFLL